VRIVVAPDKFKGTLTAEQAAAAMAAGARQALPDVRIDLHPIADGGEGTIAAFVAAGATEVRTRVDGPLGAPVTAVWARRGAAAVVEAAQANGLVLLTPTPATALAATTDGVGQLIGAVLDAGCTDLVLAIGGSATTDGGTGMARSLGVRFLDRSGRELTRDDTDLRRLASIDASELDRRVHGLAVTVACDVDNPLTGPSGAAAIYGPQKGAGPAEVAALDAGLARLAVILRATDPATLPGHDRIDALETTAGAGAAGGLGAGAIAFLGGRLTSGADLVLDLVGIDDALAGADLVLTGEGGLDEQSLRGKAPGALAARARAAGGVAVIAIAGMVDLTPAATAAAGISHTFSLVELVDDPADARSRAAELLTTQAANAVRWWLARQSG
jgi:glycerate kinase